MSDSPDRSHLDVSAYIELQKRVFDLFPYISCEESNFSTYSDILASVLLDAASYFDSLAQTFIRHRITLGTPFRGQEGIKKRYSIWDYRESFESQFAFSRRALNLNPYGGDYYTPPYNCLHEGASQFRLVPFEAWSQGGRPTWWEAFTRIKHDRIQFLRYATLGNTLNATGATFVVLTYYHEAFMQSHERPMEALRLFTPLYWRLAGGAGVTSPRFATAP